MLYPITVEDLDTSGGELSLHVLNAIDRVRKLRHCVAGYNVFQIIPMPEDGQRIEGSRPPGARVLFSRKEQTIPQPHGIADIVNLFTSTKMNGTFQIYCGYNDQIGNVASPVAPRGWIVTSVGRFAKGLEYEILPVDCTQAESCKGFCCQSPCPLEHYQIHLNREEIHGKIDKNKEDNKIVVKLYDAINHGNEEDYNQAKCILLTATLSVFELAEAFFDPGPTPEKTCKTGKMDLTPDV